MSKGTPVHVRKHKRRIAQIMDHIQGYLTRYARDNNGNPRIRIREPEDPLLHVGAITPKEIDEILTEFRFY